MEAIQDIIETPVPQPELDSFEAYEAAKVAPKVEDEKTAADAEKPTEPPVKLETPGDSEEKAGKPKRDRTAEGRIAELTNQLKAQKEEFERWKAQQTAPATALAEKQPESATGEPDLDKFVAELKGDERYELAIMRYNKALRQYEKEQEKAESAQRETEARTQEMQAKTQEKIAKAHEKYEDFGDLMTKPIPASLQPALLEFIQEFDDLGAIRELLSNPEELQRISQLSKARQLVELGKIDDRLSKPEPKPTAPPVSKAPAPIRNIGGSASEANDDITQAKSLEEYERMREKQRKRG
jgi:hypothetical protein